MKTGFLSDIHGNWESLEEALKIFKTQRVDRIMCAGDVVGYGPNPEECVAQLMAMKIPCVRGNHDVMAIKENEGFEFGGSALQAIQWTQVQLSQGSLNWLKALPYFHREEDGPFVVSHASIRYPQGWEYILHRYQSPREFESFQERFGVLGHTHVPVVFELTALGSQTVLIDYKEPVPLNRGSRYVVNVGSVGQPRDGNPRGCVMIFDDLEDTFTFIRYAYDVVAVQQKMKAAGLPESLIRRLSLGR